MSDEKTVTHIHKKLGESPEELTYKGVTIKIHHRLITNDYVWIFRVIKETRHAGKTIQHADAVKHAKRRVDVITKYDSPDEP